MQARHRSIVVTRFQAKRTGKHCRPTKTWTFNRPSWSASWWASWPLAWSPSSISGGGCRRAGETRRSLRWSCLTCSASLASVSSSPGSSPRAAVSDRRSCCLRRPPRRHSRPHCHVGACQACELGHRTLGAAFFIPTVIVPPLLITHALVFRLLEGKDAAGPWDARHRAEVCQRRAGVFSHQRRFGPGCGGVATRFGNRRGSQVQV